MEIKTDCRKCGNLFRSVDLVDVGGSLECYDCFHGKTQAENPHQSEGQTCNGT